MYHQSLDALPCRLCLHQDFQGKHFGYHFGNEVLFISFLIVTGVLGYYINEIFLFKKDKYRKYFTEFEKKKRYLLYYGIYVVSTVMQVATFYLLLNNA